jgi:hypothetical protein
MQPCWSRTRANSAYSLNTSNLNKQSYHQLYTDHANKCEFDSDQKPEHTGVVPPNLMSVELAEALRAFFCSANCNTADNILVDAQTRSNNRSASQAGHQTARLVVAVG